ncbi:trichohyalin-like isoform X3 [Pieris brassicae]|uniref:trichohyalin-like isoform X3 n=1 Tax=Pieris brassicae TaxID=7116 RepID=UPI001E660B6F|nr:trichohyalin-like isoform X3 [Pieris brassicae]
MMITIHGLPPNVKYHDLKAVIKQECNVTDFILDNLLPEGNGLKKVRMGLANDSEGNHLIKILDGYNFSGYILQVTTIGKSASIQSEQQNAFPDYSRVDPWNNQAQWNSAQQQQQNQHNYQQINSYAPSNVGNQPPRTQYDQRISILDRIGPPSQGFSVTPKTSPPHTVSQVSSQPSRGGYLRSVELVDTSHVPQRQDNFVGTHNRPTTINKDNFRGRQYNTPTEQNLGHYQQQSWGPQVPKQDLLPKNPRTAYDTPSQDKRAPIKDAIKDMSFKEKHQFQGRALEISSQERIDSTRRNIPSSDIHMSHPRRFSPPERRVSPNARRTSPERPGRPSSPSYRPVIPDSQYRPFQESQSYRASSPSNRQIVQSGRRVSPGRRMSPTAQRISPFGRSISMQGRPVSPSRRRISPGRKMSPTGRGRARHVSPMRKEAMDERNISGRREDMRRTSPKRPVQERYSPARNFNDTRLAKQVRPAYDSALDSKQATYSGGFRQNENVRYANKGREERADPWTNRVGEHNKSHAEDRRDMGRMAKFELPRSIEHSRVMEDEVKRSSSRNRESRSPRRERSPIRDRFKRHSPSPRSPRRSWALEKRRSPEDAEVPPPPIWPGQDHSAIKDIREKRKPYPAQAQASRGPTWDMNKYEPTLNERREIRTTADDRRVFERPSIQVRKDLEKWKPIGNDSPKLSPPRYKPEENERALRRRDIEIRHQDHRMQDNERKIRPDRKEFEEPRRDDERHYKSAFTDASEFSKIKEELTRRIEKKSEILKKQEELQKEIEDVYKRAADFTKKAEYRKGDRRHDGYKEQRSRDDLDPKEFDLPTLTRLKEERRERYYEREDTRPESRDKISRHEDSRADDASEKRNKACESITDKILEKFGGMLPKDILLRVQKEMKVAVRKILNRMFGDEDVSFIEMIIKFNSKHSTKDEEDIYDRVLASFSYQFKNIKRPAKDEPSEIAAKIPKMSPISNVEKELIFRRKETLSRNVTSKKLVKRTDMKTQSVEKRKVIEKKATVEVEDDDDETVKIESQEEIEAMFPTQAVQDTKELDQLTSKLLEYELRHIMIKVWQVFPDDPVTDDVKFVTEKFRNEAGDDLRNVIGLNVTKRLLNVHNKLIVKVRFSCRPEKENLLAFLKKYRVTGFKRIKSATNTFAAHLKNIDDFDKICSTKEIRCGKSKITITPCYNFMKRPPHLKTKFVDDTDDEKAHESQDIQQKPKEAAEIKLKVEVKAPEDKINIETTPLHNKEIIGYSIHKLETMKKSTNENTVIDRPNPKTDFNTKPSINTPTTIESVPKSAEKVVASGTKVTRPTTTKNNTAFKKPVPGDQICLVSKKQNIESAKKLQTKATENFSRSIQKSPKVTKTESKEFVKKFVAAKSQAKIVGPVKKTKVKFPVAMQKINKNNIINKYNDYDEMNDEDIVALLADAVVLDEYASDDE